MKILHTSDWHLGQNFMGKSREDEHKAFLLWLRDILQEQEISVLLVAGDIFDTGTPPNYALELYYNFLKELSSIKSLKKTIITAGNHDSIATLKAPKQLLEVLNVHIVTSGENEDIIIPIKEENSTKAIVCAVPFLRDSVIKKHTSSQTSSQKNKTTNEAIKSYYQNAYQKAEELREDKNIPIIAMGHLSTVGSRTSVSERDIYIGGTLDIGGDYLGNLFDYVALGHLHINQKVQVEHVRYSGSPLPLSFSESNNTQKINIINFEDKKPIISEITIPLTRELLLIKGDSKTICDSLEQIEDKNSWIEVHIKDDNPMYANEQIRQKASDLELNLLAVKVQRTQKQKNQKEQIAISLEDLEVDDVFNKRLEQENISDEKLKQDLKINFKKVFQKVSNL